MVLFSRLTKTSSVEGFIRGNVSSTCVKLHFLFVCKSIGSIWFILDGYLEGVYHTNIPLPGIFDKEGDSNAS